MSGDFLLWGLNRWLLPGVEPSGLIQARLVEYRRCQANEEK